MILYFANCNYENTANLFDILNLLFINSEMKKGKIDRLLKVLSSCSPLNAGGLPAFYVK